MLLHGLIFAIIGFNLEDAAVALVRLGLGESIQLRSLYKLAVNLPVIIYFPSDLGFSIDWHRSITR